MAVTTKKITTVDTATTFDDVFVNTDGTLRQVPKADFQQASGIIDLNNKLLQFLPNVDDIISSFPKKKITTDVDYLVNDADTTFPEKYGRLCIRRTDNNNDLIAIFFSWNTNGHGAVYERMFVSGAWSSWVKQPTRSEVDANTAAIAALNSSIEESLTYTYNNKSVTITFSVNNNILTMAMNKTDESMALPTSWKAIGTLATIKPGVNRYIPFISSNGQTGTVRVYPDGGVQLIAHTSTAMWLQCTAASAYKEAK